MTGRENQSRSLCRWGIEVFAFVVTTGLLAGLLVSCSGENAPLSSPIQTETVAGVDADTNGVRDDVDRYIDTTYADQASADLKKAVRQYARAVQSSLIDAGSPTLSLTHATERFRALECLMARRPRDFHTVFVDVRAQLLNTSSRSEAYLKADDQVKTASIPVLPADQWVTACQS
ncbi:MAG: hypothetical protein JNN16_12990 [Nitrospira sp.]|nr:hypothetical protein [Nitrospira sp.]